jgi:hypothetical protein
MVDMGDDREVAQVHGRGTPWPEKRAGNLAATRCAAKACFALHKIFYDEAFIRTARDAWLGG